MASLCWAVILLAGLSCISALGTPTSVERYPSIAQVESRVGLLWLQQCAGSVITSYHVLSAASCFSDATFSVRNRRIRAGASIRGTDGVVVNINTVHVHPSFGLLQKDGDLVIARLSTALPLGGTIQQAQILGQGIYLPYGLRLQLVGWGTTTEGGIIGDGRLHELDLYTVEDYRCMDVYYPEYVITENMFCVGLSYTQGRDLDPRDGGSPLIYDDVTVGVVSFGVSNGNNSHPLVSTAIASYTNWIIETALH